MVKAMNDDFIVLLVTTADKAEAEKIAKALLNEQLIACANIVGPVTSLFNWQEKIDCADEYLMIMKSRMELFEAVSERVKALHSYEVPEILAVPIVKGSRAYFDWVAGVLK
jgi:periplasmic divalent cation tolerance protein